VTGQGRVPRGLATSAAPRVGTLSAHAAVQRSIGELRDFAPEFSAARVLTRPQTLVAVTCLVGVAASLAFATIITCTLIIAVVTLIYLASAMYRVAMFFGSLGKAGLLCVTDQQARAIPDRDLPEYTVLVAVYKEPEVMPQLLTALHQFDYPRNRLEVRLLIEADDAATIEAFYRYRPDHHIGLVMVPPSEPRTKPKALNYGLLMTDGELVAIYDAEDLPDPLQLRKAVLGFRRSAPWVGCLQAKLSFYNPRQNLITRWFTLEYATWFPYYLPGLHRQRAPLPLGGTSCHFRRNMLEEVLAWDPFNVTEDADLGIRLHRLGWRSVVLDSTTHEEANSDFVNWVKQRSRWYKGYLQTWLVHMRRPVRTWRELGASGFLGFNLIVGGTPITAIVSPFFWGLTVLWFVGHPAFMLAIFPGWLYYAAVFSWVFGNSAIVYIGIIVARECGYPDLVPAALLMPVYWVMMSAAAMKALLQLPRSSTRWEKTAHGLAEKRGDE
jgi:cellulose synthase/poly-beta-1,6-N-acetylglucosamine synthase-like glycosyltransferase